MAPVCLGVQITYSSLDTDAGTDSPFEADLQLGACILASPYYALPSFQTGFSVLIELDIRDSLFSGGIIKCLRQSCGPS